MDHHVRFLHEIHPAVAARDAELLRVIDDAMLEGTRRSGSWVVCRPGCTQCCMGAFEITELDAVRLRLGLQQLHESEPERADRVISRTAEYLQTPDEDDKPCPILDPGTGRCDLYSARPITCRVFGAATVDADSNVAACELCYEGATEDQIAACAVATDPDGLEADLLEQSGLGRMTTVARALAAARELN